MLRYHNKKWSNELYLRELDGLTLENQNQCYYTGFPTANFKLRFNFDQFSNVVKLVFGGADLHAGDRMLNK